MEWPHLKWSHDSRFFARQATDTISVYEMPNCGLLDKKSLKCPGVRGFSWSPKDNFISYWVPEQGEAPARVTIIGESLFFYQVFQWKIQEFQDVMRSV